MRDDFLKSEKKKKLIRNIHGDDRVPWDVGRDCHGDTFMALYLSGPPSYFAQ